jgi:hypothetical protein
MLVHLSKKKSVEVASFAAASAAIRAHWNDRSSTTFYRDPKAGIIEDSGKPVAHVSYNGRVWEGTSRFTLGNTEIQL